MEYVPFAVAALWFAVRERRGESTRSLVAIPALITPLLWFGMAWAVGWLSPGVAPVDFWTTVVLLGLLPALAYEGARTAYARFPENPTRDDLPVIVEPIAGVAVGGTLVALILRLVVTGRYETIGTVEVAIAAVLRKIRGESLALQRGDEADQQYSTAADGIDGVSTQSLSARSQ